MDKQKTIVSATVICCNVRYRIKLINETLFPTVSHQDFHKLHDMGWKKNLFPGTQDKTSNCPLPIVTTPSKHPNFQERSLRDSQFVFSAILVQHKKDKLFPISFLQMPWVQQFQNLSWANKLLWNLSLEIYFLCPTPLPPYHPLKKDICKFSIHTVLYIHVYFFYQELPYSNVRLLELKLPPTNLPLRLMPELS